MNRLAVAALELASDDEVLELGCGPGHAISLIAAQAPQARIHAIDQSSVMLAQARARNRAAVSRGQVRLYRQQFEEIPLPDRSIDKALAVNVAYFWHDADRVVTEIRRVLRPGGLLALYVTDAASMSQWKFADGETHRHFDRDTLIGVLRHGGFHDDRIIVSRAVVFNGITGLFATARRSDGGV